MDNIFLTKEDIQRTIKILDEVKNTPYEKDSDNAAFLKYVRAILVKFVRDLGFKARETGLNSQNQKYQHYVGVKFLPEQYKKNFDLFYFQLEINNENLFLSTTFNFDKLPPNLTWDNLAKPTIKSISYEQNLTNGRLAGEICQYVLKHIEYLNGINKIFNEKK